jgi:hypothetical protein
LISLAFDAIIHSSKARRTHMGILSWLGFGKKEEEEVPKFDPPELGLYYGRWTDVRDFLKDGEEWAMPEEWFDDLDGKRVRRKKRKCCGGRCSEYTPEP